MAFAHETYVALAALVLFFLTLGKVGSSAARSVALTLALGALVSSLVALGAHGELFSGVYRVDLFSQSFKILIALGFFLAVLFGEGLRGVDRFHETDYYLFLSLSVLGLTMLVSATELLALYVALELSSYSLYIMVPMRRGEYSLQMESSAKYVLFGAAASGISLFGMSYVFGLAQTTRIDELIRVYPAIAQTPMGFVALAMLFAGFFFKLALFPFHLWTPDIYEGAANETSGVIATLPKIGAVAVLIRLTGMGGDAATFTNLLILLAVLSMTYGNLAALPQTDVKRLLAFSSISHAGYMMTGILSGSIQGKAAAMFYVGGYLLMNLALFHVIYTLAPRGENISVDNLKGLYKRSPVLAFTLATAAFGLAGIPPTAGFAGKFFCLTAAFQQGHTWLVIIGAVNTAISIFYYLRLVRAAYTAEGEEANAALAVSPTAKALGAAFVVAILAMGSLPGGIVDLFKSAFH